ncbi:hypothetical protein KUTeg_023322 [Tegillarca granosa]|uniref:NAD(P)-binding domain-containing protein n=1 Tax=Tegillarca granosa TaxID=220873 RepID=A0ABQ9E6U5_TEGGR|nr:hypothetical protein KUTeg_023322 [Tegillarca granosa]
MLRYMFYGCHECIVGTSLAVLVISAFLGCVLYTFEIDFVQDLDIICSMAESAEDNFEKFRNEKHSAFVLGYTGETGKVLVKELAKAKLFDKIYLIGRRQVPLGPDVGTEFEQKVVDFDNLEAHADVFSNIDTGFCCLGTTKGKSGAKGFVKVDHDYVLSAAEIAKKSGCNHFTVMSTQRADKNSSLLYTRTKGQVEEALKVIHFDRLSIFRPGVVLKPVAYLFPTAITTPVETVARAMINNAVTQSGKTTEVYENRAIHYLSGTYDKGSA